MFNHVSQPNTFTTCFMNCKYLRMIGRSGNHSLFSSISMIRDITTCEYISRLRTGLMGIDKNPKIKHNLGDSILPLSSKINPCHLFLEDIEKCV
ncbi:hypothetical protein Sjap_011383 [Stephania japonica]|uniref:Uncharacterized protein n=1 Tax=Stephania japonica TaxID=461633 RepID=A0AAP0JBA7_9MAGN